MSEEVNRLEGHPIDPKPPEESADAGKPSKRDHTENRKAKPAKQISRRAKPVISE